ncbi:HvfC family RiPP maturation protein [Neisseria sicca]|uniref:HvfC family RiPP maturation protein n=1 Tax=Neisseria sicca TaxID=490 RepID=UPI000D2F6164|nr:putative DNA-binding domain-containing protein [Neisseria sicca]MBF1284759.1 putative DNA-binding domain-containing protein [Neisseria sp.]
MQPETSAQYQHRFAQAIREGEAAAGLPQDRLNVYIRLIRNNIHSFIDRCYTETPQYLDSEEWGRLKEGFIRDARAQTPYFQEIAGEFLQYCQSLPLSDDLLALMDFEHTQLLAEVAQTDSQTPPADSDDLAYTLSPATFVRRYQYDVTDELQAVETAVLVWRDSEDDVMYQILDDFDDFDALLLETLADTPTSLNGLQTMLAEFMSSENGWQDALTQKWSDWLEQGILVAASAEVV